jgi:Haem-binding domain
MKKLLIGLVVVFIIIQFIRPAENHSSAVSTNDIAVLFPMSDSVRSILAKACYDCHSDNTRYPWYNRVQPVTWWLNNHVTDGKRHLNLSEFGSYPADRQEKKMKGIVKEIQSGDMPLDSYLWIHKDAVLTETEKQTLIHWAQSIEGNTGKS